MDEREWHAHLDSAVSTDVRDEGDTTAEAEHSSLAALSFGEGATTSVADMIGFHTPDERAPSTPSVEPEEILAEFDGLAARLTAGAETMSELDAGGDSQFGEDAADLIGDRVNRGASLVSNLLVAGTTQNGQRYGSPARPDRSKSPVEIASAD